MSTGDDAGGERRFAIEVVIERRPDIDFDDLIDVLDELGIDTDEPTLIADLDVLGYDVDAEDIADAPDPALVSPDIGSGAVSPVAAPPVDAPLDASVAARTDRAPPVGGSTARGGPDTLDGAATRRPPARRRDEHDRVPDRRSGGGRGAAAMNTDEKGRPAPETSRVASVRIIGGGRAGRSLGAALAAAGWEVDGYLGQEDDPRAAAEGVDLLVIATPDAVVGDVASRVEPLAATVVAHLAGSLGLDVLDPHPRRASVHPLVPLPDPDVGATLLRGAVMAVAGDHVAWEVVAALGGRPVEVPDEQRAAYHAAACIASNHLVALLGQVERVAAPVGLPLEAYLGLAAATLDNVARLGPAAALTGPAARSDDATLDRHRGALDPSERSAYDALAAEARRLAGRGDLGAGPAGGSTDDPREG